MAEPQPTGVTPGVPPSNGGDQPQDAQDQTQEKVNQAKQKAEQLKQAAPDQLGQAASTVQRQAKENPLPFALGGALIAGFLFGRLSKRS